MIVMIFNIFGVIIIDNFRYILLFQAKFNFSNMIYFESRLTKISERSEVLPYEQRRDRLWHTPIEVVVIIIIFFEYVILKIRNSEIGYYDAEIAMTF